jgi:aspartyl-tRNA(Asn)/glutamyl-tRNA(Gln) amidotransferase subunit C
MKISETEMNKISKLAMVEISPEEKDDFLKKINEIIEYIDKINDIDTSNIEPTIHIFETKNIFRKDEVQQSIDSDELKKIVPDYKDGYIVVPKIIE